MKRLITCSDGTWDKPGDKGQNGQPLDSNVCLLFNAIKSIADDGTPQLKVYDTGVGTGYSWRDKLLGGITGLGIDKKIKDIYTFLVMTYEPGDEIYLFGFSRGAYTARSLAGLIRNTGILKPDFIHLVDKAYDLYRDRNEYTAPDSDLMRAFRQNYSYEDITRIKFIGVWDTVGALGIPLPAWKLYNRERYKFHDVTLSSTVDYAYQALAVDERRKPFNASIWQASSNAVDGKQTLEMEQRWFAGVHCNVGGGYEDRGLSNETLKWLTDNAKLRGLELEDVKLEPYTPNHLGVKRNSFTLPFWFTGRIWRNIEHPEDGPQIIDDSVFKRLAADPSYRPKNLKKYFPKP
ncbi:DUF2235 domain-containing protein [Mucilaginibacter sp. RS28]|uniref:DUF2235 domain-containing protein n=1 Tax=Mucilaginibacter straminoryzae TaxID=2932774 RepID=A0A9X1X3P9_9SPHI|nr:DUF2235 domain-containing protein [Mucilaginibacter straminoryzae]MCJ8209765.1 DUF2235 domain-containing protein [Mucilaginibacter straminoryzae]